MDVLRLIKEDHNELRRLVKELSGATAVNQRRQALDQISSHIGKHLYVEAEYLYPEVTDLFSGAAGFVQTWATTQKAIRRGLGELQTINEKKPLVPKTFEEKMARFTTLLERHLTEEEEILMPKMRELISTQEREDLGQVYLDIAESYSSVKAPKAKKAAKSLN